MIEDSILENLDEKQRAAASTLIGPLRILAGAGTGKTRTITHRIAYGIKTGIYSQNNVLAITFTKKAADELKERLGSLGVRKVNARTFHSEAFRQLNQFWEEIYNCPAPKLIDNKRKFLLEAIEEMKSYNMLSIVDSKIEPYNQNSSNKIMNKNSTKLDHLYLDTILNQIDKAKVNFITPKTFKEKFPKLGIKEEAEIDIDLLGEIYNYFEKVKSSQNIVDFNDVLIVMSALIETNETVRVRVRNKYKYIIVDEYQDQNPLQERFLRLMLGDNDNLCVVGDASQTIYSFAGATPYYLVNFQKRFENSTSISLDIDYRSTTNIVSLANSVLDNKESKKFEPVILKSYSKRGNKIKWGIFETDELEIQEIVNIIKNSSKIDKNSCAILVRINSSISPIVQELQKQRVEYNIRYNSPLILESENEDKGVEIMSIHSAKGLEFDTVFIPQVYDQNIPYRLADTPYEIEEERRLLYVAITRAKKNLFISYSKFKHQGLKTKRRVSQFLDKQWNK